MDRIGGGQLSHGVVVLDDRQIFHRMYPGTQLGEKCHRGTIEDTLQGYHDIRGIKQSFE